MKKILSFLPLLLLLASASAYAECSFDGASYPTGTVIAGLECQEDGSWKAV